MPGKCTTDTATLASRCVASRSDLVACCKTMAYDEAVELWWADEEADYVRN